MGIIRKAYIFIVAIGLAPLTLEAYANPLVCENTTTNDASSANVTECIESNSIHDHFESSYNKYSYTLQESTTVRNQINDILGVKNILHRRKKNQAGFPEHRMAKDSVDVWDSYKDLMQRQYNPVSKKTQDIPSGYNSSLAN